ncbi:hypothetical protein B0H14DRAFT_3441943 [Mycena olivaceomarginata]|nr:hypothetical protein B0H14DRAFT_3441943 [Mycena olivaceomarginata]
MSHLSNLDCTDFSPRPYAKPNRIVMGVVFVVPLSLVAFYNGVLRSGGRKHACVKPSSVYAHYSL